MSDYISKDKTISKIWSVFHSCVNNSFLFNFEEEKAIKKFCSMLQRAIKELPTLDEKEIIRKPFERVVERLEERVQWYEVYGDCEGNSYRAYDHAIEIVKEECGISE